MYNLKYNNNIQVEISKDMWLDLEDFIDKYAEKIRLILDLWITDKEYIKNELIKNN